MINFKNDYNSPGHPAILKAVADAADSKFPGYGTDEATDRAKQKIAALIGSRGCDGIHFLPGGTQVNLTAVSAFLRPHEAVVAAGSSHVQMHETGAIEATGHRVLLTDSHTDAAALYLSSQAEGASGAKGAPAAQGGKLTADSVRRICEMHTDEHMVKPRLVYISQATELGGVYSLAELRALREACDEHKLLLYMDGARLGVALTSPGVDMGLSDVAALCDAFYIGGAKNGLLFGEALVISNEALGEDFRFIQKQRGGLLAKGFLLGIQFGALFENDLFFKIARHANAMAAKLRAGLEGLGCSFLVASLTNQLFPVLRVEQVAKLEENFLFERWEHIGGDLAAVRFVTSWNTSEDDVDALINTVASVL
ncbi:MAG: beta-eliminating lyase-related protein [Oscillospiraceae bacterium]|nr:beta-eliminating lyase-related protein [Oscillospiraceae bacterium]